jgi:hypothetical protein
MLTDTQHISYTTVRAEPKQNWMKKRKGMIYTHPFSVVWQCTKSQIRALSTAEYDDRDHNHTYLVMLLYNTPEPKHISCITLMNTIFTWIWDHFLPSSPPKNGRLPYNWVKLKHVQYMYFHWNLKIVRGTVLYSANTITWNRLQRCS